MGAGIHPVASNSTRHALATESRTSPGRVFLTITTTAGVPAGNFVTGLTSPPAFNADPVVAPLGTNGFVAAWTASPVGGDGDELGIAMQTFVGETPGPVTFANTQTAFGQRRPDIIWTGTEFIVAWEDQADLDTGPDLHVRSFSPTLVGGTETTLAGTTDAETRVALAAFQGSYVAAWRAAADGFEHIRVQKKDGPIVELSAQVGADADDAPTIVPVSSTKVLVAFARTEADTTRLRAAVVDVVAGTASEQALIPTPSGYDAERAPSLTLVGSADAIFLGWTAHQHDLSGEGDDTFLQQVEVDGDTVTLIGTQRRFPTSHIAGSDQRRLRLAPRYSASLSTPTLFLAWEDDTAPAMFGDPRPDVAFTLIPYPIFDFPPGE